MSRLQPSYDIITGAELPAASQPTREPPRESQWQQKSTRNFSNSNGAKSSFVEEELRGQLNTLQYDLDALRQERDLHNLSQQRELQGAQSRAEAEAKKAAAAIAERDAEKEKAEKLRRQFVEGNDRLENEKAGLEKKVRGLVNDNRGLREEFEEAREEVEELRRRGEKEVKEAERRIEPLELQLQEAERDAEEKVQALRGAQERFRLAEQRLEGLEGEIMGLRQRAGDGDALEIVRRELEGEKSEVQRLWAERKNLKAEIETLRARAQGAEMVRQECEELRARVGGYEEMELELQHIVRRQQALEDERTAWSSYMAEDNGGEAMDFQTPEEMARAFAQERVDRINLATKLGAVQPDLDSKEEALQELRQELEKVRSELETLGASAGEATSNAPAPVLGMTFDAKAKTRLEKQKRLALKEVEHLRQQLKDFEMDEDEKEDVPVEDAQGKRIAELDDMLKDYREELQKLHIELSQLESQPAPASPKKRTHDQIDDSEADEQRGELIRKTRALQEELETAQRQTQSLEAALEASNDKMTQLRESSKTRILSLKDNPTSRAESIKLATLTTLREENAALLAQLSGNLTTKVVPVSALQDSQHQMDALRTDLATAEKKLLRLKQIYTSKSLEFREAVASVLGWKLDFMPNGRVKATSILYPVRINGEGEEEENSIVFDGENGTMKISGGAKSDFAQEIKGSVEFWVDGRGEVPCFLAALTLEFYEKTTRAVA